MTSADATAARRRGPGGWVAAAGEIAAYVAFPLSDEAAFITGAARPIDGGAMA